MIFESIKSVIFCRHSSLFFLGFLFTSVLSNQVVAQSEVPDSGFDDRPYVVASVPALHSITAIILGDVIDPGLLIQPGQSPEEASTAERQHRLLEESDLVLWLGAGFEPGLAADIGRFASKAKHVDMSDVSGLRNITGSRLWLDPVALRVMGGTVVELVSALDPERFEIYFGNIAIVEEQLELLQRDIEKQLSPYRPLPFRVIGADLSAYAERFGLDGYQATDPRCILSTDEADLERGVATALLDDLGRGLEPGPDFIEKHLRRMTGQIIQCLTDGRQE